MAAPAIKTLTPVTEPATPLERLHQDRAGLTSELVTLNASSARLQETANAEAAVLQEIGAMGSAEIAAMTAWAAGGCVGGQPAPDQKQRRTLAEKLSAAQSAATAAKAVGADIDGKIAELNDKLRTIADQIEIAALDATEAELRQIRQQHAAAIEIVRQTTAKLFGYCSLLSNTGRSLMDRGEVDAAKRYFVRAEAAVAAANKMAKPDVSQMEIMRAGEAWGHRIAALRSGSAS